MRECCMRSRDWRPGGHAKLPGAAAQAHPAADVLSPHQSNPAFSFFLINTAPQRNPPLFSFSNQHRTATKPSSTACCARTLWRWHPSFTVSHAGGACPPPTLAPSRGCSARPHCCAGVRCPACVEVAPIMYSGRALAEQALAACPACCDCERSLWEQHLDGTAAS